MSEIIYHAKTVPCESSGLYKAVISVVLMQAFHSAVRSLKAVRPNRYFGRSTVNQLSSTADSFLSGSSSVYVDQMYRRWLKDRETYF